MTGETSRKYIPRDIKILTHPIRINLLELIRQGAKTTPEMAEILGENRVNLYHHLKKLEEAGLIQSYFGESGVKIYKYIPSTLIKKSSQRSVGKKLMKTKNIVLPPPKDKSQYTKFKQLLFEMSNIVGVEIGDNMEIMQVQITLQDAKIQQKKLQELEKVLDKYHE